MNEWFAARVNKACCAYECICGVLYNNCNGSKSKSEIEEAV